MIIGVDIDGVILNLSSYVRKEMSKKFKLERKKLTFNKYRNSIKEQYNLTDKEDFDFWFIDSQLFRYGKKATMKLNANKIIDKLKKQGHQIYIVTSRTFASDDNAYGEKMRKIVEKSLEKNKIHYDKLIYTNETDGKVQGCLDNGVEILIDDSPRNLIEVGKYIPVICFSDKTNHNLKMENMTRCNSWKDIFRVINEKNDKTKK